MSLTKTEFTNYLKKFDFRNLFNEMGWNNDKTKLPIVVDDAAFELQVVAEKSGFKILVCSPLPNGSIPEYTIRRTIDNKTTKFFHEHLLIFVNKNNTEQLWQLVVKQPPKPITVTTTRWNKKQSIDLLYQRFANVFFELDEEDKITIIDVKNRLLENFQVNNEKVTKKFYDRFKTEHEKFKSFIKGIKEIADLEWYVSLMLNRLMFIYFIQKKRFLDGDIHYLKNRLQEIQNLHGKNKFHQTFYRYFLLKLFHNGLGKRERNKELEKLIGKIPYLNGGFFEVHEIESRNDNIDIPDEAFEKLFQFFDEYEWHLDTRHQVTGKEINPDVVGYIFEKYINQKEKGAYYTKEDITEYISKNTIIPFLFDKSGIDENHPVWKLLQNDPDRYIYDAVKTGILRKDIDKEEVEIVSLPPDIEIGINNVSQRTDWNKPASSDYALPTETWREHIERRKRCLDIRNKIKSGDVKTVNDLITFNLDIRQLAQDMIVNTDDSEWLWQFYSALDSVTILDPTCGSGAFLFAAMNILEPLYEACLDRMENMTPPTHKIAEVLKKIKLHPNRRYFIYKNIILNNLYGVDIMDEAIEICKLRLFLKLAAEVETDDKMEPLPDIDFNIRSGNTLVGYVSLEQIKETQKDKLTLDDELQKIEQNANNIDKMFQEFRKCQINEDQNQAKFISNLKGDLRNKLNNLRDQLDHYLANEYKINLEKPDEFSAWQKSHQPFHWIVEFYGILHNGGFDVVIGNPPYVEYSNVKKSYIIQEYKTETCGNLYTSIIERSIKIVKKKSRVGMIIQISAFCTQRMSAFQNLWFDNSAKSFTSFFDDRPGKLFDGLNHIKVAICMNEVGKNLNNKFATTRFTRFYTEVRYALFQTLVYADLPQIYRTKTHVKRLASSIEINIVDKINKGQTLENFVINGSKNNLFYKNAGNQYFRMCYTKQPSMEKNGLPINSSTLNSVSFSFDKYIAMAIISSNLFNYWWFITSDTYHLTKFDIFSFRVFTITNLSSSQQMKLIKLGQSLEKDYWNNSQIKRTYYKNIGEIKYQEFYAKQSKPIIDEIDRELAQHYGFTDEELDFIINYDIKYRMGGEEE
ncbi:MAG: Eco57I restriction-modification methylase domain-containing protein [Planctomycetaceae bacterium]|jgi:tRNA1(Val) A37 N6-methylase TrmN6|nr:Eco57I restriction-modification methylase domain-containing protein [Planctomycetaceae bacterium]